MHDYKLWLCKLDTCWRSDTCCSEQQAKRGEGQLETVMGAAMDIPERRKYSKSTDVWPRLQSDKVVLEPLFAGSFSIRKEMRERHLHYLLERAWALFVFPRVSSVWKHYQVKHSRLLFNTNQQQNLSSSEGETRPHFETLNWKAETSS